MGADDAGGVRGWIASHGIAAVAGQGCGFGTGNTDGARRKRRQGSAGAIGTRYHRAFARAFASDSPSL